jgi:hypothetical protein
VFIYLLKRTKFSEPLAAVAKSLSQKASTYVDNMAVGPRVSLRRTFAEGAFEIDHLFQNFKKLYVSAHCRVITPSLYQVVSELLYRLCAEWLDLCRARGGACHAYTRSLYFCDLGSGRSLDNFYFCSSMPALYCRV